MKLFRSFSIIAGLTLLGSFLGYFRDLALAVNYGASTTTDAYFAAYFLPNTLYLIFLSNSIALVFLPIFIEYRQKDETEAWQIASNLFNFSFLFLSVVIILMALSVQYWMPVLFAGFSESTMQLAAELTVIMLPVLLFLGLSTLFAAILNSFEHFTMPALAPAITNIFVIIVIILSSKWGGIYLVAIGVTLGALIHFLIQIPVLIKYQATYTFSLNIRDPALLRIFKLAAPLIVFLMISYATLTIERNLASSFSEGTISSISYALRLFSIPIAFFASSLGTVIYPRLSLEAVNQDSNSFSGNLVTAVGVTIMFLLPLSFWMIINSRSIVNLLFGYGRFSTEDVNLTAFILSGYAIGMTANGVTRILLRSFYALQNTIAPFIAEGISFLFYIGLVLILIQRIGAAGLGIARGISFIFIVIVSFWLLKKHPQITFSWNTILSMVSRYLLASLCAAIIWLGLAWIASNSVYEMGRIAELIYLISTGIIGAIVFGIVAHLLKAEEILLVNHLWLNIKSMIVMKIHRFI